MTRKKWSKQKIIDEILKLHKNGKDLSSQGIRKNFDSLWGAAMRYFGSWGNAIKATGLDYEEIKEKAEQGRIEKVSIWSKQKVVNEISELHEAGENLSSAYMQKNNNSLYKAGVRYFGSWKKAMEAAGLDYSKINLYSWREVWSKQKIISEIKELHEAGEDLSDSSLAKKYPKLRKAAITYFGSLRKAIETAGFDYDEIIKYEFWNKQKIIEGILELKERGEDLNSKYVHKTYTKLANAARIHFGSWENAIKAAGLDYEKIRQVEFWDKQKIIAKIKDLFDAGEDLSATNIQKIYPKLIGSACRYFDSWQNAIEAAGLDYNKIIKVEFWDKRKILNKIHELHEAGEDLNDTSISKTHSKLYSAAVNKRHFGSWGKAIEAAGLDYEKILEIAEQKRVEKVSIWSKERIIEEILKMYNAGQDLYGRSMQKTNSTLYNAAIGDRYFGSWENAIEATGLDYDEIRIGESWSKEKIIGKIRELHEAGENLSSAYIQKHYTALSVAACKKNFFENWENAITAAGLDYEKIRLDIKTEFYKGRLFEKYLKEIFKAHGKKVYVQKRFKFEEEACIPDFVDKDTGEWIDAKLKSWTGGIEGSARKYLKYVDRVIIYYLIGEPRRWYKDKVVFKCVKDFYPQLKELGKDDIVQELSLLERGVIPSKYQTDLDKYLKMEESEEHIASIED